MLVSQRIVGVQRQCSLSLGSLVILCSEFHVSGMKRIPELDQCPPNPHAKQHHPLLAQQVAHLVGHQLGELSGEQGQVSARVEVRIRPSKAQAGLDRDLHALPERIGGRPHRWRLCLRFQSVNGRPVLREKVIEP